MNPATLRPDTREARRACLDARRIELEGQVRRRAIGVLVAIAVLSIAALVVGCSSLEIESDNTAAGKQTIKAGGVPLPHPLAPRASRRVTKTAPATGATSEECTTCEGATCDAPPAR